MKYFGEKILEERIVVLVRTQNFPKNYNFLPPPPPPPNPPDMQLYAVVSQGKKYCFIRKFRVRTK